ncbi:MAG: SpaA isopeptide-forming pilin-related protein [Clostridium sp.]
MTGKRGMKNEKLKMLTRKRVIACCVLVGVIFNNIIPIIPVNAGQKTIQGSELVSLGDHTTYNVVAFGNHTASNADVEGKLAVQGNFTGPTSMNDQSFTIAAAFNGNGVAIGDQILDTSTPTFLLGGNISKPGTGKLLISAGTSAVTSNANMSLLVGADKYNGNVVVSKAEIDNTFKSMKAELDSLNKVVGKLEPGTIEIPNTSLGIVEVKDNSKILVNSQGRNDEVLDIRGEWGTFKLPDLDNRDLLIMYSDAKTVNFDNTSMYYKGQLLSTATTKNIIKEIASKILWIFPNATEVNSTKGDVIGSVIAPNSTVNLYGGSINGQIFTHDFNQISGSTGGYGGEAHNFRVDWPKLEELLKSGFELEKKGSDNKLLAGAEFKLYKTESGQPDKYIGTYTTDSNGKLKVDGLDAGTYRLIETKSPEGYELDSTPIDFEIKFGQTTPLLLNHTNNKIEYGNAEIIKVDASTNKPLEGAKFEVRDSSGNLIGTYTTDKDGKIEISNLLAGTYTVKEVEAPAGYEISKEEFTIVITTPQTEPYILQIDNTVKPEAIIGDVELIKSDADDNSKLLDGAEFELYRVEDGKADEKIGGTYKTENGLLSVKGLPLGKYYFIETKAPEGYLLDQTKQYFTITFNNPEVVKVTMTNKKDPDSLIGSVKLKKLGYENKLLKGVKFELFKDNGKDKSEWESLGIHETNENGEIVVENLTLGKYYFKEVEALDGYVISDKELDFEVKFNQKDIIELTLKNNPTEEALKGDAELIKRDAETGNPLKGAQFTILDSNKNPLMDPHNVPYLLTSNEEGKVIVKDLKPGIYYFKEVKAPEGYELDSTLIQFEIIFNQTSIVTKSFNNAPTFEAAHGDIKLIKKGYEDRLLKGAKFNLYKKDGTFVSEHTTDVNGEIIITDLKYGDYYLQEVQAPNGYITDGNPIYFTIDFNQKVIEVKETTNTPTENALKGNVKLVKTGYQDALLEGAEFELYKVGVSEKLGTYTTNENGEIVVLNLDLGDYYFVETKAPEGYEIDSTPIEFTINFNTEETIPTKLVGVVNKVSEGALKGGVRLLKTGHEGIRLKDAVFGLYSEDGTLLKEYTTDSNGEIIITGLDLGKYYLQEIKAPAGYELSTKKYEFEIKFNSQEVQEFTAENKALESALKGSVRLIKTSSLTGKTLEGAEFKVLDENKEPVKISFLRYIVKSNANGEVIVNNLPIGKYYFQEVKAPEGYEINEELIPFEIKFNETMTYTRDFENEPKESSLVGGVKLIKRGYNNQLLQGAKFQLFKVETDAATGEVIEVPMSIYESNLNGEIEISNLQLGDYYLQEVEAPNGYITSDEKHKFTIEFNQTVNKSVDAKNEATEEALKGGFRLLKEGHFGALKGAEFDLYKIEGTTAKKVNSYVTNEQGIIEDDKLEIGSYYLVETKAPEGYELDATPIYFDVEFNQVALEPLKMTNVAKSEALVGNVKLIKTGYKGQLLQGAKFKLVKVETIDGQRVEKEVSTHTTNKEGVITIENLELGEYYLQEVEAPSGYVVSDKKYEFSIKFNSTEVISFDAVNEAIEDAKKGDVKLKKTGYNDALLKGAKFKLVKVEDENGNAVNEELGTYETNASGEIEIKDLEIGKYYLQEVEAPNGYVLSDTKYNFEIAFNQSKAFEITAVNKATESALKGNVKLVKKGHFGLLKGAEFTLFKVEDENKIPLDKYYTNENGEIVINDLPLGKYCLIETKAPEGYILDTTPINFEIEFNQTNIIELEMTNVAKPEALLGNVELIKTGYKGELLKNVEFRLVSVKTIDGNVVETEINTYKTNEEGKIIIEGLELGDYYLQEVEAPSGYVTSDKKHEFKVEFNGAKLQTINAVNEPTKEALEGTVRLLKTGYFGVLQGAEFELFRVVGEGKDQVETSLGKHTTNENGEIVINKLPLGKYYLKETKAPEGYILDETPIHFEVKFNENKVIELTKENEVKAESLKGGVKLVKTGYKNSLLQGAKFKLVKVNGDVETLIDEYTTNENGEIIIENLELGDYYMQEVAAPEGYITSDYKHEFKIEFNDQKGIEIKAVNKVKPEAIKGNARLIKKDALTKNPLKGAKFIVLDENKVPIKNQSGGNYEFISNADGVVLVTELPLGKYYFKEIKAPDGYELSQELIEFEIKFNNTETVEKVFENTPKAEALVGDVELIKKGHEGKLLQGVKFGLYHEDGTLIEEYTTNENGEISIKGLGLGIYYMQEIETLDGYQISNEQYKFKIEFNKENKFTFTAINRPTEEALKGSVKLLKSGKDGVLQGAAFKLVKVEGEREVLVGNYITNGNGVILVEDLELGKYYFEETKAPEGYELDTTKKYFDIEFNNKEVIEIKMTNKVKAEALKGGVKLVKTGYNGNLLEGAKFKLVKLDGDNEIFISNHTTNKDGEIIIEDLELGKYYLQEVAAPTGYILSDEKYNFEIKFNSQEGIRIDAENEATEEAIKGDAILFKKDAATKNPLMGAWFKVLDSELNPVKDPHGVEYLLISDENGQVKVSNLEVGTYYFKEVKAPDGYELNETPIKFEIEFNQTSVSSITFENTPKEEALNGDVKLIKKSLNSSELLDGAEFKLVKVNEDGTEELVDNYTTKSGVIEVNNLPLGKYYFEETKAPEGYELDSTKRYFDVKFNEKETIEVELTNKVKESALVGNVRLFKEGRFGALEGAEFKLVKVEDYKEVHVGNYVTNEQGEISIENLPLGKYYFEETKAPEGYELDTTKKYFEIVFNHTEEILVEMYNEVKAEALLGDVILVKTGYKGQLLEGAKFNLYKADGTFVSKHETDKNGEISIKDLELGDYYLQEVEAPNGYVISNEKYNFKIEFNQTATIKIDAVNEADENALIGDVKLIKKSLNSSELLSGAEFKLVKVNEDGTEEFIGNYKTNLGIIEVNNLPLGNYYFEETKAPEGYELDKTQRKFEVKFNQTNVIEIEVTNTATIEALHGGVKLVKTGYNNCLLEGAKFRLVKVDGSNETFVNEYTTNANGEIIIEGLTIGSYYLQEVEAPNGYITSNEKHTFDVVFNQQSLVELTAVNTATEDALKGDAVLNKVDSLSKHPLEGAEFTILDENLNPLKDDSGREYLIKSDENGQVKVTDLAIGTYYFKEVKAPEGYELNETLVKFEITFNQEARTVTTFENAPKESALHGNVKLVKKGYKDVLLQGAKFKLVKVDGANETLVNEYITNENGEITINNLPLGKYYLQEVEAPNGYITSDTKYPFEIKFNESETIKISAVNSPTKEALHGKVRLVKKSQHNGELLMGAEFKLVRVNEDNSEVLVGNYTTSDIGEIRVDNLLIGNYYFEETKAPEGFELNTEKIRFTVEFNKEETINLEFKNKLEEKPEVPETPEGSIVLTKKDQDNGKVLPGAEFALYKLEDGQSEFIGTHITDAYGELRVSDLVIGDYYFLEIKAPEGYELPMPQLRIDFTIIEDQILQVVATNKKLQEFDPAAVMLRKVDDETGVKLVGAEFKLLDEEGRELGRYTTDNDGEIYISRIRPGKYSFVETKAPNGYELDETPIYFEAIDYHIGLIELEFKNTKTEEPVDPEEPGNPEESVDPEEPGKPEGPEEPVNPEEPGKPEKPSKPETNVSGDKLPQTGENPLTSPFAIGMLMVVVGVWIRRKW